MVDRNEELLRAQAWMKDYWARQDEQKKASYRKASEMIVRQDGGQPDYTESERGDNRVHWNLGDGCRRVPRSRPT